MDLVELHGILLSLTHILDMGNDGNNAWVNSSVQAKNTDGNSKNSRNVKARSTEISIWHGNLQGRFTAAAAAPGWMSAWVNLQGDRCLGSGQMLRNRAGVPGPGLLVELSCSQVSLEPRWLPAAVALELLFEDDCAILDLQEKSATSPPGSTKFWLTDPILPHLLTHFSCSWTVLKDLWLFKPSLPLFGCNPPFLGFWVLSSPVSRRFWLPQLLLQQGCS